jgi:hypothetical protein
MTIIFRYRLVISSVSSLVYLAMTLPASMSFAINQNKQYFRCNFQVNNALIEASENIICIENRRAFLRTTQTVLISSIASLDILTSESIPALAADTSADTMLPTKEIVTECFDFIRFELENPEGGVAYMQGRIDKKDFEGLLDFSKSYDLEFRKRRFGNAKKLLEGKELKAKATEYANAVTFDLIGINRSCRKGQENIESASKYLQELRDDVSKFLALEKTIEVET